MRKFNIKEVIKKKAITQKVKGLYKIISVVSTFTIFIGVIYYIIGRISNNNMSDNDLVMNQIKKEIYQYENSVDIRTDDLHGFGYNSVIVTSYNNRNSTKDTTDNNKILILESVNNEILHSMNDPFGAKSSYKTKYSLNLTNVNMKLCPEINRVDDIIGDSTKEIIINYFVFGSNYDSFYPIILKYSYEKETYEIVGTYPKIEKVNLIEYNEEGNYIGQTAKIYDSELYSFEENNIFYGNGKQYNLIEYSGYTRDYWLNFSDFGKMFVAVNYNRYDNTCLVNCFQVLYDPENNTISWNLLHSDETDSLKLDYSENDLCKYLMDKYDCMVTVQ